MIGEAIGIYSVGDGAADAHIIKRLLLGVEADHAEFAGWYGIDDNAGFFLHAVDPQLILAAVDEIEFAGLEGQVARAVGRDEAIDDAVDLGLAAEVAGVGHHGDALVGLVALEGERTGADGVDAEILAALFDSFLRDNVAAVIVGDDAEQRGDGRFEFDHYGRGVSCGDAFDAGVVA